MSQPDHTHTYQCQWENVAIIGEEQAGAGLTLSNLEQHNLGAGRWLRGHLMGVWGCVSMCIRGVRVLISVCVYMCVSVYECEDV